MVVIFAGQLISEMRQLHGVIVGIFPNPITTINTVFQMFRKMSINMSTYGFFTQIGIYDYFVLRKRNKKEKTKIVVNNFFIMV